ncbi:MAG: hypothetical protein DMG12_02500 [Acidobacteria bacterium]|nr:MAG: hypothetical protein DMG12_02500 [Acidobacteriota bacterium]
MRNRYIGLMLALTVVLSFSIVALMQARPQQAQKTQAGTKAAFDPHDLSGIYLRRGGNRGFGPPNSIPPMTPAGEEIMKVRIPSPGYNRHPLTKKIENQEESNDPTFACNPKGFPRIVLDTAHDYHEVIMLPDRILQMWQEARVPREFWLDGRKLPTHDDLANLGPAWYGHSVAKWEADELVVQTVGLDERAWLDQYGFPKSFDARIEERYKKTDANTLELRLTLYDPAYYTRPWVSDVKIWKKEPRKNVTWFGWYGLYSGLGELLCAPMNASPVNKRGG